MGKITTGTAVCSLTLDEIHALRLEAADERLIGKLDTGPKDGILGANEISNGLRSLDSRKSVSKLYTALFAQTPPKALSLLKVMGPLTRLTLLTSLPPVSMTAVLERLSSQDIVQLIQTGLMAMPTSGQPIAPLIAFAYPRLTQQVQALFRDEPLAVQVRFLLLSTESVQRGLLTNLVHKRGEEGIRDLAYIIRYMAQVDANGVFGALFFRQMDPETVERAIAYPVPSSDHSQFKKYLKSVSAYSPKKMPLLRQVEYYPTREQAEAKTKENGWSIAAKTSAKHDLRLSFVESYNFGGVLVVPDGKDRVYIVESMLTHKDTPKEKERRQKILEKAFPPGFKFE